MAPARVAFVICILSMFLILLGRNTPTSAVVPGASGKIAWAGGVQSGYDIFVVNPDGTNPIQLTSGSRDNEGPSWSPDGSKIAFASTRDGNSEVYWMYADGSNQTRLTYSPSIDHQPSWSPDGTQIAFDSDRAGSSDIWLMDVTGGDLAQVTNTPASDSSPSWSPDGAKIAFSSDEGGDNEIVVIDSNGLNRLPLTGNSANDFDPAWSPDGQKIAFYSLRTGNSEIYVMGRDGSNETALTLNPGEDINPTWSPMGDAIIFSSERPNTASLDIFKMSVQGDGLVHIATGAYGDYSADWQSLPDDDSDGVASAVDNCPTVANANQSNVDGDPAGDACEPANCIAVPNWWGSPGGDDDCDGFASIYETDPDIATDPNDACANTATPNDETDDKWPADFNDNQVINTLDLTGYATRLNTIPVTALDRRYDLNQNGAINTLDLVIYAAALNHSCVPPA